MGTGTMKWVWVRERVPNHVETRVRVRVPQWVLGYGYNEMGMVRVWVPSHVETRVRVPQWVLGYGYGYNEMGMGMSMGTKPC